VNVIEKRRSLGIPANAFVVGTIGRLVELKGYSQLIDAASLVIKQDSEVFFLIIGDGELSEQLKFQADQKGVSSNIFFTGGRQDIEELFVCMDLFVSSSYWEALPTVILESMAAGVPIVATDIPGTRELIRDKQNGWLVPPRDAFALAQTILVALNDAKSRRLFADNARLDVKQFSIRVIAAEYETLYSSLVQSTPQ
jgi:glycosyltransferase involved in cell wall biosynthesis